MLAAVLCLALAAAAPQELLREVSAALEREDFVAAAGLLEKVVLADPEDFQARSDLAYAYTRLEEDVKAIAHYEKVLERKAGLLPVHANLGMLLMRQRQPARALPHLRIVAEAKPAEFRFQHYLARALLSTQQYEAAISAFDRAIELDARSADAYLGRGEALAKLERFDQAAEAYRRAAEREPEMGSMILQVAELLEKKGRVEEALVLYQERLASHDGASHDGAIAVRERIGFLLLNLKRYSEAVSELEAAVEQNPTPANQAPLAQAYSMNDQPDKVLPLLAEAVTGEPSNAALRLRYANALLQSSAFEQAAHHYLAVVKLDPDRAEAWNGVAFSLNRLENYPGALRALAEAARRAPVKPAAVYLRAITQDKIQMYKEALASYEEFLTMTSGMADEEWKSRQRIKVIHRVLRKSR
jgi:tetratricopeptide (TPR) repeat protein